MTWYRHYNGHVSEHQISQHDRPVVVIDPEDAEQTGQLLAVLTERWGPSFDLAAALREFAAPTPPEPPAVDFDLTPAVRQAVGVGAPVIIAGRRYIAEDVTP
jgi:hypothetical protein